MIRFDVQGGRDPITRWCSAMLDRRVRPLNKTQEEEEKDRPRLWNELLSRPAELDELFPSWRHVAHRRSKKERRTVDESVHQTPAGDSIDHAITLELGDSSRSKCSAPALVVKNTASARFLATGAAVSPPAPRAGYRLVPATLTSVRVTVFPSGFGVLAIQLEWIDSRGNLRLDAVIDRVCAGRRMDGTNRTSGWLLQGEPLTVQDAERLESLLVNPADAQQGELLPSYLDWLGEVSPAAHGDRKPVALRQLAAWLLGCDRPGVRSTLSHSHFAEHHTVIVLRREPDGPKTNAAVFRLMHGHDATYPTPPDAPQIPGVIRPRGNRIIGIAREGSVALSWLVDGANPEFELRQWHTTFMGVYLWLRMHAMCELADYVDLQLKVKTIAARIDTRLGSSRIGTVVKAVELALLRQTLFMSVPDLGGPSDFVQFFRSTRACFDVEGQAAAARIQIQDAAALLRTISEKRVERIVFAISVLAIPAAIVQGLTNAYPRLTGWLRSDPDLNPVLCERGTLLLAAATGFMIIVAFVSSLAFRGGRRK